MKSNKRPDKGFAQEGALTSPRSRAAWNVLNRYHPYRYGAYRTSWAPQLLKKYRSLNDGKLVSTEQGPDTESPEEYANRDDGWGRLWSLISPQVLKAAEDTHGTTPYAFNAAVVARLLTKRLIEEGSLHMDHPLQRAFSSSVAAEAKLYAHWACHTLNNRAIFDFTPDLVNMFTRSNVGDALLNQIHLPAETVYLHFGVQPEFPLRGLLSRSVKSISHLTEPDDYQTPSEWKNLKYCLEGAYVSRNSLEPEGSLEIILIGRPLDSDPLPPPQNFIDSTDESMSHHLPCLAPGLTVQAALIQERDRNEAGHIATLKRSFELIDDGETLFEDESALDDYIAQSRQGEIQAHAEFDKALNLVLNAVLYITAYPDELDTEYPPTPLEISPLIEKAEGDCLQRETRRAQAQLEDLGYVKVKFCGRRITQKARQLAERNETEGRARTFKGRLGTWRWLDAAKGHFKISRNVWVRPSPDPTGTKRLTIYEVNG